MARDNGLVFQGKVTDVLPGSKYRVKIEENQHMILAYLSGKMRQHKIKIVTGDTVDVEVSLDDITQGRISYRHK